MTTAKFGALLATDHSLVLDVFGKSNQAWGAIQDISINTMPSSQDCHTSSSMEESALQLDAAGTRMVTLHSYSDEFDTLYEPLYLCGQNRGFHDLKTASIARALTLIEENLPVGVREWDISVNGVWEFRFASVWLRLEPSASTIDFLTTEVIGISTSLSVATIDSLRRELEEFIKGSIAAVEIFLDVTILILQLVEVTSYFCSGFINQTSAVGVFKWSNDSVKTSQVMKWNRAGLNPLTVTDTCFDYLGLTPLDICRMIPKHYRILEMKSVRSEDLTNEFISFREKFIHKSKHTTTDELRRKLHPLHGLQRRNLATVGRDEIIAEMMRPHATFHGTTQYSVGLITKHGFRKPGEKVEDLTIASPRSGAIFRRGIYSSQEAWYAMSFAECHSDQPVPLDELPGMRLFVCATVTGRTLKLNPNTDYDNDELYTQIHGPKVKGFDTHFDGGFEYVVHDTHAMLPCYVLSLDFGPKARREVRENQRLYGRYGAYDGSTTAKRSNRPGRQEPLFPGEKREKEQETRAMASKLLPLGFGAAQGISFHVTEVVDTSDDEELQDATDYHALKNKTEWESGHTFDFWMEVLAGRGPQLTHEPENALPLNIEKLLCLEE